MVAGTEAADAAPAQAAWVTVGILPPFARGAAHEHSFAAGMAAGAY